MQMGKYGSLTARAGHLPNQVTVIWLPSGVLRKDDSHLCQFEALPFASAWASRETWIDYARYLR